MTDYWKNTMGIDGIFLYALKKEISGACMNTRVDKVHQPSKEELVLLLRSAGVNHRLLICIRPSVPRINFIKDSPENPAEPPMFCMLARKYLSGARFSCIEDSGFERIAVLVFDSINEMGDSIKIRLIAEFIGKQTNIILVGNDGRIIDCVRRSDLESAGRIIQPGAKYVYPEKQDKIDILKSNCAEAVSRISSADKPLSGAIVSAIDGISPLISREISVRAGLDTELNADSLGKADKDRLAAVLESIKKDILQPLPTAVTDKNGVPFEFSYTDITQYGESAGKVRFDSLSELLDAVYSERDRIERIRVLGNDLVKLLGNLHARITKKQALREKELDRCADGEKFRIYGELLKANMFRVERGVPYIDVENYYDPELKKVRIPLNIAISPAQNAQRYFREYKKCCNASAILGDLIAESRAELEYIESVMDELSRASSVSDLKEIRLELETAGYLKAPGSSRKSKSMQSKPLETVSPDGFKVLIGRNNRQNDELTLKTADNGDMWFHTKNIPGSHVIVVCKGEELPETTVFFAARLAAEHSGASGSSSVPVDYTRVKYVKKPTGAKPGMVIYKTNRTVYVTPERGAL